MARDWSLTIDGLVGAPLTLTLDDIKNGFEKVTVTMTIQVRCAALLGPASPISQD